MALHYGYVDGTQVTLVSSDIQVNITGSAGSYVLEFDRPVKAFVGTGHGGGETCNSRNVLLTASPERGHPNKICVHTFLVYPNLPTGPIQKADFSFVVAF